MRRHRLAEHDRRGRRLVWHLWQPSAVRTYGEGHRRDRIWAEFLHAEAHVRAGEPRGLTLAHHAIEAVSTLQSVAVRRQRLIPLTTALEARPGTDNRELAQLARNIAVTRI